MFAKENRYITRGISERLPKEIQQSLWLQIDIQNDGIAEMDYLQVFKFENLDDKVLVIIHSQEQPERNAVMYVPYRKEYEEFLDDTIFVIDDEDHSTMLFSEEY